MGRLALVFYYHRLNRYSFNALAGALDEDPQLSELPVHLPKTAEEVFSKTSELLRDGLPVVVGLSILTPQFEEMLGIVRRLGSEFGRRVTIIAGGPHATAEPGALLESGVDVVFRGEAEISFPSFLKHFLSGQNVRDVPGIASKRDGTVVNHPRGRPVDIDTFRSFSPRRFMLGPIEITRGCPFACNFCQTSRIFGVQVRHRSIDNIVRQAETLMSLRSRNGKVVRLLSPNAFSYGSPDGREINLSAMQKLLSALRETMTSEGKIIFGYFPSEVRPEHVTEDTLGLLREFADNDEVVIGAQSGSERVLETCNRGHSVDAVIRAVSLARRFGYKVIVDLILGLPGEKPSDVSDTVAVIETLLRLGARVHPHAFVPLPQTPFWTEHPGTIPPEIIRALDNMSQQKAIYGDWVEQRKLADRICRHKSKPQRHKDTENKI
jgi:B12-binding domain/radical SAM domain protein